MKKRLRLLLGLGLALGLIVALALPTSHFVIMGALRRESFYQGRPTSYWISALKKDAFLGESAPADVGKLLREGGEAAVPVLVEMVKDQDEYVSMEALLALGVMSPHPTSAVPALIECLKYRDYRSQYLTLLVGILIREDRQKAIEALIQALREHEDSGLRAKIALVLGNLGPGGWSAGVRLSNMEAAGSQQPTAVRLDWLRGPEAATVIAALHDLLQDTASAVRISAASALWQLDRQAEPLIPLLCQELKAGNNAPSSLLSEMGPVAKAAVPDLIEVLEDKGSSLRREVARVLGSIGPDARAAIPSLIAAARETNEDDEIGIGSGASWRWTLRGQAFEALGRISPEAALPILTQALKDRHRCVRIDAARGLGSLTKAAQSAVQALIVAGKEADPDVRNAVTQALGQLGEPVLSAVPALIAGLKDPDASARSGSAFALGRAPLWTTSAGAFPAPGSKATWVKSAVPALTATLKDEHPLVRLNAAEALWLIDEQYVRIDGQAPNGLPALLELLKEKEVRGAAIDLLKRMGSQAKAAVPALTRLLDDEDRDIRQGAAEALKQINPIVSPRAGFPGGESQNVPISSAR